MSIAAITRSETTKQFTTSMWWILAIVLAVYIAFTASVLAFALAATSSGALSDGQSVPIPGLAPLLYSTATSVGYVFPLLIGTLMVTTEFRHKTLTPTFLATPRRGLVLTGKALTGVLLGALFAVIGIAASVGPAAAFLAGYGLDTELDAADTWAQLGRMVLAFVLWVLVGLGVGTVVRNQVGAIVGVLVFTQFIEPIGRAAASFVDGLGDATRLLPGAASDALVGQSVFLVAAPLGSEPLEWWVGGLVLLGYAVVLMVLGQLISWRRDVT